MQFTPTISSLDFDIFYNSANNLLVFCTFASVTKKLIPYPVPVHSFYLPFILLLYNDSCLLLFHFMPDHCYIILPMT